MTELAREYGEGLYELAHEENLQTTINEELKALTGIFRSQPDYLRLLDSRAIPLEVRLDVVDQTFKDKAHPYLVNFIKLLTQRGKIDAFCDCAQWFLNRYNEAFGIVGARVVSAQTLSGDQQSALKEKLMAMSGKQVEVTWEVDASLLGGLRVEMNGQRYDNTIQNRLERLKDSLIRD